MDKKAMSEKASEYRIPLSLLEETKKKRRFTVVNFAAGGIATPADAALMMALGADGVFVGSGIFKSENPRIMAKAIVESVIHYQDPPKLAEISKGLGRAMIGLEMDSLNIKMAGRGV